MSSYRISVSPFPAPRPDPTAAESGGRDRALHFLRTYLPDHHAGSVAARALLKRMIESNRDQPIEPALRVLRDEIEYDSDIAEQVLEALDIRPSPLKDLAARAGEKLGRLKLNGQLTGYSPLSRLFELEGLHAGIAAKRSGWRVLQVHASIDARLASFDFAQLEQRALAQLSLVEDWHQWAAAALSATQPTHH